MQDVQALFREYVALDRKRTGDGLTPLEYQRWADLSERLHKQLSIGPPGSAERRSSVRTPTRIVAEFRSEDHLRRAIIRNLSGTGVFVNTPFGPDVGTEIVLRIRVRSSGRVVDLPGVVVSQNVGDGFTTNQLGMGVRFRNLDRDQQQVLDELRVAALADEDDATASD